MMDPLETLLPRPRRIVRHEGHCRIHARCRFEALPDDPRIEAACRRWLAELPPDDATSDPVALHIVCDAAASLEIKHPHGYRLTIAATHIDLTARSPAGCFFGIQTLVHLSRTGNGAIPCCTILDWPDFSNRGLLHDVSRGKVPTLNTLKLLADRLAELKANQLQLYIEHAFVFSFDPNICGPDDGLTPDEIRELHDYCNDRFIDLVPAVATVGHMGRILSLPRYRKLAEVETTTAWEDMTWAQRARGLTLDCTNPAAAELAERIWTDILDAIPSSIVNICCDEPWDLWHGKTFARHGRDGCAEAYIEQVRHRHAFCAARGRRAQVFSDVLRKLPYSLHRLPRDLTVLHWGYDDHTEYEATGEFVNAGFETCVCPGTSGWKRIINAINLAERNIAAFASAGRRFGAVGLINTDWGDHGHFHPLACSWHGIALGAAMAWSADHPIGAEFDRRFAQTMWGLDAEGIDLLRRASHIADTCETWRLFYSPPSAMRDDPTLPSRDAAEASAEAARRLRDWCERVVRTTEAAQSGLQSRSEQTRDDLAELAVAARFTELFAEKLALLERVHCPSQDDVERVDSESKPSRRLQPARYPGIGGLQPEQGSHATNFSEQWSQRVLAAADAHAECWTRRNKPSGLTDIRRALAASARVSA